MIYVGSSWKNGQWLDVIHDGLWERDVETWDFRKNGFWWGDIKMGPDPYDFLNAPEARDAFQFDKKGLDKSSVGLFILPAGISTALECGYMAGQGKPTVVWGTPRDRLDIMWLFATEILSPTKHNYKEAIRIAADLHEKANVRNR